MEDRSRFEITSANSLKLGIAPRLYQRLEELRVRKGFEYNDITSSLSGSNVFSAILLNRVAKEYGAEAVNLRDLSRPEVRKILREYDIPRTYYTDAPVLVLRSIKDDFEPNRPLIKALLPYVEEYQGKLELPALITGFDVEPSGDKKGYRLIIVPNKDFKAVYSDKLEGKFNLHKYLNVDEMGLPIFDNEGHRTWYARGKGLAGIYFDNSLFSEREDLSVSNERGLSLIKIFLKSA